MSVRRLARAAWPRLAQAARGSGAAAIVLAQHRLADGVAAVAIQLRQQGVQWSGNLFAGVTVSATLTRSRFDPAERAALLMLGEHAVEIDGVAVQRWERAEVVEEGDERAASG
jgi:hypothetical protein